MNKNILLTILSSFVVILLLEFVFSVTTINESMIWKSLSIVNGPNEYAGKTITRVSDGERLYELIPSQSAICYNCPHPKDMKNFTTIHTNNLGFRDKDRNTEKPEGVFRIIILGGSNTFGYAVSDNETYPAQLDELLNEMYPGRFEVWNAGLNAYVPSQQAAYGDIISAKYDPDLFIFEMTNDNRRHFFYSPESLELFDMNPELWHENIPYFFSDSACANDIHHRLIDYSDFYRFIMIGINNFYFHNLKKNSIPPWNIPPWYSHDLHYYAQGISKDAVLEFREKNNVLMFYPLRCGPKKDGIFLCNRPSSKEYSEIHPPSYVYKYYADEIAAYLIEEGYIEIPYS